MASTNKTANYDLSQYIGTDKPTYLGDYNGDMQKIDTAIKEASDSATTANTNATQAQTAANNAQATANTANTKANTADGKADANATAIEALTDYLNINTYKDLVVTGVTNANITTNNMKIARNSDGTIAKVYGRILMTIPANGTVVVTLNAQDGTGVEPDEDITINCAGVCYTSQAQDNPYYNDITFKTNGDIVITFYGYNNETRRIIFLPCLYFIKNFGDIPSNT